MENKYIYTTFDNVNSEQNIHPSFADLKDYLSIFLERLNDENESLGENYVYECNDFEDAENICEVCNINLKTKLANEPLYTIHDPEFNGDDGDLLYVNKAEVIAFANEEVRYTIKPNIRFTYLDDAITFLRKYNFKIILHEEYSADTLVEWLAAFEESSYVFFDYVKYIKNLNDELGLSGKHSRVIEEENGIDITTIIEASNQTSILITLDREDLEINYNNGALQDYILGEYKKAIDNFDVDEEFTEIWNRSLPMYAGLTPTQLLKMLNDDLDFFKYQLGVFVLLNGNNKN